MTELLVTLDLPQLGWSPLCGVGPRCPSPFAVDLNGSALVCMISGMADIGVLLRGLDKPMLFEAEEWKFSERFLRLLEGDHVVAQFPTRSVLGVWFEETPAISESTADVVVVLPHSYAGELGAEDVAGEQTEA